MSVAAKKRTVSSELLHDLRSPLNQIIGYSEMLAEDSLERESVALDLEKIKAAGHRMLAIIEDNFTAGGEKVTAPAASTPDCPPLQARARPATEPAVVLVVDDDAENRDVLSRRLQRQSHHVEAVSSGPEALRRLRDGTFDLVLLDIMMPGMDGYEVLRHIRGMEAIGHIPVIMISAVNEVQSIVRCIDAGAEDYLTKPFDATLLNARVGATLQRKRGRDREAALFEQLQQNFKRLEAMEKLRDDMRNMIVHDLRTPLTSLLLGMELLETTGLTASQQEMLTLAIGGGRTLLGMINDLLDVEKMESGTAHLHYADVSAAPMIAAAIDQVAALAREAGTVIVTEVAASLPAFAADEKKITRTLVNLIGNAIKYAGRGTVTVTASHSVDGHVRFAVRDTGSGIPREAFQSIFEKFRQLEHNKVGTGLGLAFCKLAVEAHGGRIEVESEAGIGSTFAFELPVTRAATS